MILKQKNDAKAYILPFNSCVISCKNLQAITPTRYRLVGNVQWQRVFLRP